MTDSGLTGTDGVYSTRRKTMYTENEPQNIVSKRNNSQNVFEIIFAPSRE